MNYGATNRVAERAAATTTALANRSRSASGKPTSTPRAAAVAPKPIKTISRFSKRVRANELANLTAQLAIMAKSGVDIASALQTLSRQCTHVTLKRVLLNVHENVLSGNSLSDSLQQFPTVFNETFTASVAAGEASGRLPDVLQQLAYLLRSQLKLRNSIRTMLAYPVLLSLVSSSVLLALIVFVLPRFAEIFADFEAPLPIITQVLIAVSSELRTRFWLWLPLAAGLVAGCMAFKRSPRGRALWDRFLLNGPLFRDVTRTLLTGRCCRLLGLMIESGVPLLESIRLTRSSVKNLLFRELFLRLEDDVLNGRGFSTALNESDFVPAAASEMIMTAEKTGSLGPVTAMIGQHFEEEGEAKLKEMVAIAEPVITVVMGVLVAVIVMSVMLPLFDLSSVAGKGS